MQCKRIKNKWTSDFYNFLPNYLTSKQGWMMTNLWRILDLNLSWLPSPKSLFKKNYNKLSLIVQLLFTELVQLLFTELVQLPDLLLFTEQEPPLVPPLFTEQ